jgi:hypothetical protein
MALKTIVVIVVAVTALACGGGPPQLTSQAGPSPVVLSDTSAGRLAISVRLTLGGYDTVTRDTSVNWI